MPIILKLIPRLKFAVEGSVNNDGVDEHFSFKLTAKRVDNDSLQARFVANPNQTVGEVLADVVEDWDGVKNEDGSPRPYSREALQELFSVHPGTSILAYKRYLSEVTAKEKN